MKFQECSLCPTIISSFGNTLFLKEIISEVFLINQLTLLGFKFKHDYGFNVSRMFLINQFQFIGTQKSDYFSRDDCFVIPANVLVGFGK